MKKIFCLAILALAVLPLAFSQMVSEAEARALCAGFLQKNNPGARTAAPIMETVTTARLKNGAPAYFVMQPADGKGFVVLAANRASEPVLGYSHTGHLDLQNLPPGLQYLLDDYQTQLDEMAKERVPPTPAIAQAWGKLTHQDQTENSPSTSVGPLVITKWGQSPRYNNKCPNGGSLTGNPAPTGCVATAMAQLMYYWTFPISNQTTGVQDTDSNAANGITGIFSAQVGGGYHWGNMPLQLTSSSTVSQIADVAELMADCGIAAKMNYGTSVSLAYASNATLAMKKYFGYQDRPVLQKSSYTATAWSNLMKANLDAGYPMYYGGDDGTANGVGHAWVVDGYNGDKFRINWGWDGSTEDNSLWTLTDLTPGTGNYNSHQHMFAPKPGGTCTPFAVLSGAPLVTNVEVAHWISASNTLAPLPGISVVYNAHDEIVLTAGFTAVQGTDFHAYIQGCDGNFSDLDNEDRSEPAAETKVIKAGELTVAPNPFSGSTTVTYILLGEQEVAMQLFDPLGKLVATPMVAQIQSAGEYHFNLETGDLPTGLYFLLLQVGRERTTRRLALTR